MKRERMEGRGERKRTSRREGRVTRREEGGKK